MLADDLPHPGLHALCLVVAQGAQVAARHRVRRNDVGLAARVASRLLGIQLRRGAAEHQADVVSGVGFAQIPAERVEDSRELIRGPEACSLGEHAGGVAGLGLRPHRPAGAAASGDRAHVVAVFLSQRLELEGHVVPARRVQHVRA